MRRRVERVWLGGVGETGRLDAAAVRAAVDRVAPAGRAVLVGIDGCGGSGKSTLGRPLGSAGPSTVVVGVDDFSRPTVERVKAPAVFGCNFDIPRLREPVLEPGRAGRAAATSVRTGPRMP